jgi:hypothetical protein
MEPIKTITGQINKNYNIYRMNKYGRIFKNKWGVGGGDCMDFM